MLPYQEDQRMLEELLDELFSDEEKSTPEDFEIWKMPSLPETFGNCCNYNYASYGAQKRKLTIHFELSRIHLSEVEASLPQNLQQYLVLEMGCEGTY